LLLSKFMNPKEVVLCGLRGTSADVMCNFTMIVKAIRAVRNRRPPCGDAWGRAAGSAFSSRAS